MSYIWCYRVLFLVFSIWLYICGIKYLIATFSEFDYNYIFTLLVYILKGPIVKHWNVMYFTFQ